MIRAILADLRLLFRMARRRRVSRFGLLRQLLREEASRSNRLDTTYEVGNLDEFDDYPEFRAWLHRHGPFAVTQWGPCSRPPLDGTDSPPNLRGIIHTSEIGQRGR